MDRKEAVTASLTALIQDDVETAVSLSGRHFGGAGALYEKETVALVRAILEQDYTPDPAIKPGVLQPLRVVAAGLELWGAEEVNGFADVSGKWTYRLKPEEVIRMLYTAGFEQHRLDGLRQAGVTHITLRPGPEGLTAACQADAGRIFPIDDAPPLPHRDPACRCSYIAARPTEEAGAD